MNRNLGPAKKYATQTPGNEGVVPQNFDLVKECIARTPEVRKLMPS